MIPPPTPSSTPLPGSSRPEGAFLLGAVVLSLLTFAGVRAFGLTDWVSPLAMVRCLVLTAFLLLAPRVMMRGLVVTRWEFARFAAYPACILVATGLGYLSGWSFLLVAGAAGYCGYVLLRRPTSEPPRLSWWPFLLIPAFLVLFTLLLRARMFHEFAFLDALYTGDMVPLDSYFHASIAESIQRRGVVSPAMDGDVPINYHWISHLVIGSWSRLCGVNSLSFYHLLYPVVQVPLFFLVLYRFLSAWRGGGLAERPFGFVLALVGVYALPVGTLEVAHPLVSESFGFSILFLLCTAGVVDRFTAGWRTDLIEKKHDLIPATLLITGLLLLIVFTKISTGVVALSGVLLVVLRFGRFRYWLVAGGLAAVIMGLTFAFIFPYTRQSLPVEFARRVYNVTEGTAGAWQWLLPAVVALACFARDPVAALWDRATAHPLAVLLAGMALVGWAGGLYTSYNLSDVSYFIGPAFFLAVFVLAARLWEWTAYRADRHTRWVLGLIGLVAVGFLLPRTANWLLESWSTHRTVQADGRDVMEVRRQFFGRMEELGRQPTSGTEAVYVPPGEDWFYAVEGDFYSVPNRNIHRTVATVALSGRPMLGGVPNEILDGQRPYYSVGYYQLAGTRQPRTRAEAEAIARERGYTRLYIYTAAGGELQEVVSGVD